MMRFHLFNSSCGQRTAQRITAICLFLLLFPSFLPESGIVRPVPHAIFADDERNDEADDEKNDEADDAPEDEFDLEEAERNARKESRAPVPRQTTNELASINGRIGHIAFPTFGRHDSITHVELFPFLLDDNDLIFGDARLFTDNGGRFGANGGAGLRRWIPAWERALGASLWYDFDEGSGESFQALGLSLESYGEFLDIRGNGYLPIGDREKEVYEQITNTRFLGNQIVFDSLRKFAEAQAGFDLEIGVAVPSQFAADHNIRVVGGYYHFLGDEVSDIDGYKGRIEGRLMESIDLQVELTDDNTFGTNVNFGVAYHFGASPTRSVQSDKKLRQMTRYVNRNYNIIVSKGHDLSSHRPAINPETGEAYFVQHVSTATAGSGTGTASDPFLTIAEAQASNPDLIFVHSGSVLGSPVVLAPGQRLLGEGVDHVINTQGLGNVLLPRYTSGTALPLLQGVSGNAVTLASGSEFSGFVIDGSAGSGIVGSGINGATLRNVTVQNAMGDGIFLANSAGSFMLENVNLTGIGGSAFHVDGGTSDVSLVGSINNSANRSVLIENTAGGTIDLGNASVLDVGGTGILLANNAGNARFGNVHVENSSTTGIDVQGGTGTTEFTQQTTAINTAGPAINIQNAGGATHFNSVSVTNATGAQGVRIADSPGDTTFSNLNVATQGGTGLFALNSGGVGIGSGVITSANASAVDIESTAMNIGLTSVSSSNAVNGIRIVDSPGVFLVRGSGSEGSGGLIQGATVGVFAQNSGEIALQHLHLDGNTTGLMASDTQSVEFHLGRIINSASHGVDLLNVRIFDLHGSVLTNNGGNSVRGRFDVVGDYNYSLTSNTIDNAATSPIVLTTLPAGNDSTLTLSMERNAITMSAAGSQAVDVDWNGALIAKLFANAITGTGTSNTAFDVNTSSTTELAQIQVGQNLLAFGGADSVGMNLSTSGPSEISIGENSMVFNAANGTGAEFAIGQGANIHVFSNVFTDNASRGTGLLFSSITGTSNVAINNNNFQLLSADAFVDRGIIFNTVTGNVQLSGTYNNIVNGASTPFSAVGTTGQILVNGVLVP